MVAAGAGGLGFVLVGLVVNVIYVRARLPLPVAGKSLEPATDDFANVGDALKKPSIVVPAAWLFLTVFAAGLLSALWQPDTEQRMWALVGFGGVLMQNATFSVLEALRFGLAAAARRDRGSMAGLWSFSNVLFGFNQVFLAAALLGFTAAGTGAEFIPVWLTILGYVSAALLFTAAALSPYNAGGTSRFGPVGLVGWLGWITWIASHSVILIIKSV